MEKRLTCQKKIYLSKGRRSALVRSTLCNLPILSLICIQIEVLFPLEALASWGILPCGLGCVKRLFFLESLLSYHLDYGACDCLRPYTKNGLSLASYFYSNFLSQNGIIMRSPSKYILKKKASSHASVFNWEATCSKILTMDNLRKHGIVIFCGCSMYMHKCESPNHLLWCVETRRL